MIRKIKRKQGTPRYQARVKINGQHRYKSFDSYQAAVTWINKTRYQRADNIVPCQKITVLMMHQNHLESMYNKGCSPTWVYTCKNQFKNHILPFYGESDIQNITITEHKTLITCLINKGLSNASVNHVRTQMSTMYNLAIREEWFGNSLQTNPFDRIRPMKVMNQRLIYWTLEEIQTFLMSEKDSHYYPLWILLLNTGLRNGEAVAVHGEQFDRAAHILYVDRLWCHRERKIRMETKGCRIRNVGLNPAIQKIVYPFVHSGPIFKQPEGKAIGTDYLCRKLFKRACKKANVRYIGIHGLRHTFASQFIMNGGSLYDLQKILGHSNIKTTERYAHFSHSHLQRQSSIIDFQAKDNVICVDFARGGVPEGVLIDRIVAKE
ncbi:MAG: tyrosine-type recombinase/integrase [bacterium]|nr:tyrosine-type recombinase/integrase [bacterium]MBU1919060.1 tyrosine-type recombinase/integrase [bacterium]